MTLSSHGSISTTGLSFISFNVGATDFFTLNSSIYTLSNQLIPQPFICLQEVNLSPSQLKQLRFNSRKQYSFILSNDPSNLNARRTALIIPKKCICRKKRSGSSHPYVTWAFIEVSSQTGLLVISAYCNGLHDNNKDPQLHRASVFNHIKELIKRIEEEEEDTEIYVMIGADFNACAINPNHPGNESLNEFLYDTNLSFWVSKEQEEESPWISSQITPSNFPNIQNARKALLDGFAMSSSLIQVQAAVGNTKLLNGIATTHSAVWTNIDIDRLFWKIPNLHEQMDFSNRWKYTWKELSKEEQAELDTKLHRIIKEANDQLDTDDSKWPTNEQWWETWWTTLTNQTHATLQEFFPIKRTTETVWKTLTPGKFRKNLIKLRNLKNLMASNPSLARKSHKLLSRLSNISKDIDRFFSVQEIISLSDEQINNIINRCIDWLKQKIQNEEHVNLQNKIKQAIEERSQQLNCPQTIGIALDKILERKPKMLDFCQIRNNGELVQSGQEAKQIIYEHFSSKFKSTPIMGLNSNNQDLNLLGQQIYANYVPPSPELTLDPIQPTNNPSRDPNIAFRHLCDPITAEEIQQYFDRCKEKCPGPSKLSRNCFKIMGYQMMELIARLGTAFLNKGWIPKIFLKSSLWPIPKDQYFNGDLNKTRPIALCEQILKSWTSVLSHRLIYSAINHGLLADVNSGFMPGRSTLDPTLSLMEGIEDAIDSGKQKQLWLFFADIKAAYDTVPIQAMRTTFEWLNVPNTFQQFFFNLMTRATQSVITPWNNTEEYPLERGLMQGEVSSPFFYQLFTQPLLRYLNQLPSYTLSNGTKLRDGAFADDTVLVGESYDQLQQKVNVLSRFLNIWGMTQNANKAKYIVIGTQTNIPDIIVENSDGSTSNVECSNKNGPCSFRYLGFTISSNLKWDDQIEKLTIKLKELLKPVRHKRLTGTECRYIMNAVINPSILYACQLIPGNTAIFNKFDKIIIQAVKDCLRLANSTSNNMIIGPMGIRINQLSSEILGSAISTWIGRLNSSNIYTQNLCSNTIIRLIKKCPQATIGCNPLRHPDKIDGKAKYNILGRLAILLHGSGICLGQQSDMFGHLSACIERITNVEAKQLHNMNVRSIQDIIKESNIQDLSQQLSRTLNFLDTDEEEIQSHLNSLPSDDTQSNQIIGSDFSQNFNNTLLIHCPNQRLNQTQKQAWKHILNAFSNSENVDRIPPHNIVCDRSLNPDAQSWIRSYISSFPLTECQVTSIQVTAPSRNKCEAVYIDGSKCEIGEKKVATWAIVNQDSQILDRKQVIGRQTNNRAEAFASLRALAFASTSQSFTIHTDSNYTITMWDTIFNGTSPFRLNSNKSNVIGARKKDLDIILCARQWIQEHPQISVQIIKVKAHDQTTPEQHRIADRAARQLAQQIIQTTCDVVSLRPNVYQPLIWNLIPNSQIWALFTNGIKCEEDPRQTIRTINQTASFIRWIASTDRGLTVAKAMNCPTNSKGILPAIFQLSLFNEKNIAIDQLFSMISCPKEITNQNSGCWSTWQTCRWWIRAYGGSLPTQNFISKSKNQFRFGNTTIDDQPWCKLCLDIRRVQHKESLEHFLTCPILENNFNTLEQKIAQSWKIPCLSIIQPNVLWRRMGLWKRFNQQLIPNTRNLSFCKKYQKIALSEWLTGVQDIWKTRNNMIEEIKQAPQPNDEFSRLIQQIVPPLNGDLPQRFQHSDQPEIPLSRRKWTETNSSNSIIQYLDWKWSKQSCAICGSLECDNNCEDDLKKWIKRSATTIFSEDILGRGGRSILKLCKRG